MSLHPKFGSPAAGDRLMFTFPSIRKGAFKFVLPEVTKTDNEFEMKVCSQLNKMFHVSRLGGLLIIKNNVAFTDSISNEKQ